MNSSRLHRRLHLIDVENLLATGCPDNGDLNCCVAAYLGLSLLRDNDHVVLASNPMIGLEVGLAWHRGRLLVRHGPSGADLALLEVLEQEHVAERYDEVIIASGDGIFADVVARLEAAGVTVTVVAGADCLSRRLQLAASNVVIFPELPPPATPAIARKAA